MNLARLEPAPGAGRAEVAGGSRAPEARDRSQDRQL